MLYVNHFLPHGYCFSWDTTTLIFTVLGDALTAIAYFIIGVGLFYALPRFNFGRLGIAEPIVFLFGLFILACGLTHVFHIVTIWLPLYRMQSIVNLFCGVVSFITCCVLIKGWIKFRKGKAHEL